MKERIASFCFADLNISEVMITRPLYPGPADEAAGQKGRLVIEFRTEVNDLLKDFERKRGSSLRDA